jgi:hypothetical protein
MMSHVDAQNAFGAMIRSNWICAGAFVGDVGEPTADAEAYRK